MLVGGLAGFAVYDSKDTLRTKRPMKVRGPIPFYYEPLYGI